MHNHNDIQKINTLYRTTRDDLYDAIRECDAANGLSVLTKHELVQHGLLQWVALNAGWSENTDRNWELQEPLPFDSQLVSRALKEGANAWSATSNVLADQVTTSVNVKDIVPFFQKALDSFALERELAMQAGAAPGYTFVEVLSQATTSSAPLQP